MAGPWGPFPAMGILLSSGVRPILLMNIKIYISALFNIAFFFFPPKCSWNSVWRQCHSYKRIQFATYSGGSFLFLRTHSCRCCLGAGEEGKGDRARVTLETREGCLSWFAFYCCDRQNTMVKSNLGRKGRVYFTLHLSGLSEGKPQQELKQRPWRNTSYWLAQHAIVYTPESLAQRLSYP